ncbi:replication initiator protein [Capybara microvirus Cap1_SP_167]|nr:replication initiator protein [Capybara microvirus Cap1_SP_167]
MSCFHRIEAFAVPQPDGKKKVFFSPPKDRICLDWERFKVFLPCGRCIGCRLDRSREWALRCVHESVFHEENYFITLTYSPENLKSPSLLKRDLQLFNKRLRKKLGSFRYYACGEYGDNFKRPHYHELCFGLHIPDLIPFSFRNGFTFFRSKSVEHCWNLGFVTIGFVSFESAAYVARYCHKKLVGKRSSEYGLLLPEFALMSRRPGIGYQWIETFNQDVYKSDGSSFVPMRGGVRVRVPRFYDSFMEKFSPDTIINAKLYRKLSQNKSYEDVFNMPSDRQKEDVCLARVDRLVRVLEDFEN